MELDRLIGPLVIRHRVWILLAALLVVAVCGSGTRLLVINNDMRVFFSDENPQLAALKALEAIYTRDDNVFFVLEPAGHNVFTRATLSAIEDLTAKAWSMPYSSRVDSITNFQYSRAREDDLVVADLIENAAAMSDIELLQTKRLALSEPLLVNRLVSASGHVTGVNATIIVPGKSHEEVDEVTAFARDLVAQFEERHPHIKIHLAGGVIADAVFGEAAERDAVTLVPIMFVVLTVLIGLLLRSLTGTIATVLVILSAVLTGMGLAGWLGIQLTAASVAAPVIILTLAVADSVHLLETVFQQMRMGETKNAAIVESVRVNLRAVFLTSVTTMIGFLSMNLSDAPPLRDLGNIVAMGVMAALFFSMLLLPALVSVMPLKVAAQTSATERAPCDRWADLVLDHSNLVFWFALGVVLVIGAGTFRNELNDDFIKYFGKRFEIRQASDFMEQNLTGFNVIDYSLEAGSPGGINKPEYLQTVEAFAAWYRDQPKIAHVSALTDIVKRLNRNMNSDDSSFYQIPDSQELAAQYLLLYEMSLPFGLDLTNQINIDKSSSRLSVLLRDVTAKEIRETDARARAWLRANAAPEMFTHGTGLSVIWAHISARNIRNMLFASVLALALISVLLAVALRSWKLGIISLVPNLAPALMAFGLWGLLVGQVGLALSVIISMTLGIVVDDTVHFLSRYLRARRERGMLPPEAIRRTFNTVGTAMWITTVALVAGFLVLATSPYKMSADMGVMSAMTIAFALLLDFLLLPTLLLKIDRITTRASGPAPA